MVDSLAVAYSSVLRNVPPEGIGLRFQALILVSVCTFGKQFQPDFVHRLYKIRSLPQVDLTVTQRITVITTVTLLKIIPSIYHKITNSQPTISCVRSQTWVDTRLELVTNLSKDN